MSASQRPFATDAHGETRPVWSPDGRSIAYVATIDGAWHILGPLFDQDVTVFASALSRDGRQLAMLMIVPAPDWRGRRYGLFLSTPPGADPVRVEAFRLEYLVQPTDLTWSADGTRLLVYTSNPPRTQVVWPATGRIEVRPTNQAVIRAIDGRRELGELTWRTGRFRPIRVIPADFEVSNGMSWTGRMSVSHDGTALLTAVVRPTGDIWLLEGLQPPRTWWQRIFRALTCITSSQDRQPTTDNRKPKTENGSVSSPHSVHSRIRTPSSLR